MSPNEDLHGFRNLHEFIEKYVFPRIAKRLKKEGFISSYDKKDFEIPSFYKEAAIEITPDLVLHHLNGDKILVEVANLEDPKRFIGEVVYPASLKKDRQIRASLVFVIGNIKRHSRSLTQRHIMSEMLGGYSSLFVSYPNNEDAAYNWVRNFIVRVCH